ncbi:Fmp42p RNJ42_03379 [Nakaseomyces bracarensis]|uniref:Fmp42p n=1 Tax=Nakaseomyces bracarensis TaxID=273131 RepID=UPI0038726565
MDHHKLKVTQIICACVWCLFSAGIIFGFAALKPVLLQEGVYAELCVDAQGNFVPEPCTAQDLKLNSMFAISAAVTNMMALPIGSILDNYGPRITGVIGSVVLAVAASCFILNESLKNVVDPYICGYVLLSVGGPFVFISSFQLANTFPKRSGTILALLTGAFDSSSALFLFYRIIYEKVVRVGLSRFFSLYLLVPAFIFVCQVTIMPRESYKSVAAVAKLTVEHLDEEGRLLSEDDGSTIIPNSAERERILIESEHEFAENHQDAHQGRRKSILENYVENNLKEKSGGVFGILHEYSLKDQLKSPWFILILLFSIVTMLKINYFIATIRSQEEYLLGSIDKAVQINGLFDILLPIGGVVSIPFIGRVLDDLDSLSTLTIVCGMSIVIGLLGLVKSFYWVHIIEILLFVVFRPFYYTVVSDITSKVFGFNTFGTVYGLMICICGICNIGQSWLDELTHTTFNMNPTPVNIMLLAATMISCFSMLCYIYKQTERSYEQLPSIDEEQ